MKYIYYNSIYGVKLIEKEFEKLINTHSIEIIKKSLAKKHYVIKKYIGINYKYYLIGREIPEKMFLQPNIKKCIKNYLNKNLKYLLQNTYKYDHFSSTNCITI